MPVHFYKEGESVQLVRLDPLFQSLPIIPDMLFVPEIEKVIFNDPATIVFWSDGTKTIVKCSKDDTFDKEKGLAMAVCKKLLGRNHNLRKLKKWLKV